jgi:hypothetical protein
MNLVFGLKEPQNQNSIENMFPCNGIYPDKKVFNGTANGSGKASIEEPS